MEIYGKSIITNAQNSEKPIFPIISEKEHGIGSGFTALQPIKKDTHRVVETKLFGFSSFAFFSASAFCLFTKSALDKP